MEYVYDDKKFRDMNMFRNRIQKLREDVVKSYIKKEKEKK